MSSMAFHCFDKTVRVGGAERAYAGLLCERLATAILDYKTFPQGETSTLRRLKQLIPQGHYLRPRVDCGDHAGLTQHLDAAIFCGDALRWRDRPVRGMTLALNTALAVGSDPVRLLARLHGGCEIHVWVDGRDRHWLADVVEEGVASGVMRRAYQAQYDGWPAVLELLRESSQQPVVTSYSVTESFPNFQLVSGHDFEARPWRLMSGDEQLQYERKREEFDYLPVEEQWSRSMPALRERCSQLRPGDWREFRFTPGLSALDLVAPDWEQRLDRALETSG